MEEELRNLEQCIKNSNEEFAIKNNICDYSFIQTNKVKYNCINEIIDILYSLDKYNGKIRLFIKDDYNQVKIFNSTIDCKHRKKIIERISLLNIKTLILENGNLMYYITMTERDLLRYFDYSQIRVFSRNAEEYENITI